MKSILKNVGGYRVVFEWYNPGDFPQMVEEYDLDGVFDFHSVGYAVNLIDLLLLPEMQRVTAESIGSFLRDGGIIDYDRAVYIPPDTVRLVTDLDGQGILAVMLPFGFALAHKTPDFLVALERIGAIDFLPMVNRGDFWTIVGRKENW